MRPILVFVVHEGQSPRPQKTHIATASVWLWTAHFITTELSDAGGPRRPNWQPTRSARIRSSDFVRHHSENSSLKNSFPPLNRPPPQALPVQFVKLRISQASRNCAFNNG